MTRRRGAPPSAARGRQRDRRRRGRARSRSRDAVGGPQAPLSDQHRLTCKKISTLIIALHHLSKVSTDEPPPGIRKLADGISTSIRPYRPTDCTAQLIVGNARQWSYTTLIILKQHYEDLVAAATQSLGQLESSQWKTPFQVACVRAKRKFGLRITQEVLDRAEAILVSAQPTVASPPSTVLITAVSSSSPPPPPQPTGAEGGAMPVGGIAGPVPVEPAARRGGELEPTSIPAGVDALLQGARTRSTVAPSSHPPGVVQRPGPTAQPPTAGPPTPSAGASAVAAVDPQRESRQPGRRTITAQVHQPDRSTSPLLTPDHFTPSQQQDEQSRQSSWPSREGSPSWTGLIDLQTPGTHLPPTQAPEAVSGESDGEQQTSDEELCPPEQEDDEELSPMEQEDDGGLSPLEPEDDRSSCSSAPSSQLSFIFPAPTGARGPQARQAPGRAAEQQTVAETPPSDPGSPTPPGPADRNEPRGPEAPQTAGEVLQSERESIRLTPLPQRRPRAPFLTPHQSAGTTRPLLWRSAPAALALPAGPARRPTRHINTYNKLRDWRFTVRHKFIILGASNVSRFPPFQNQDLQVECFPGATFRHAEAILLKLRPVETVEVLILAFGINNRAQNAEATSIRQMQGMMRAAKLKFPRARILVPIINYSTQLPHREQVNLRAMNRAIRERLDFIPEIPREEFVTGADRIHWTHETAAKLFEHWSRVGNLLPPQA